MIRNETTAALLAMFIAALPLAAGAQTSAPTAPSGPAVSPPPQLEQRVPTRTRSGEPADARHCLDLPSNREVIACAEKYRSHRGKK